MAKTNWKVITVYDGTSDVRDVIVDMISEKIKRNLFLKVENKMERKYNLDESHNENLSGLAG